MWNIFYKTCDMFSMIHPSWKYFKWTPFV